MGADKLNELLKSLLPKKNCASSSADTDHVLGTEQGSKGGNRKRALSVCARDTVSCVECKKTMGGSPGELSEERLT